MPKIGTRVATADAALAIRIDGILIFCVTRVLNQHATLRCVKACMTRSTSRQHAIHHVNSERHVFRNLFRFADAHQISRPILRQQRSYLRRHLACDFVRLADSEAANRVTGKIDLQQLSCALAPKIGKRCALHNSKLPLLQVTDAILLFQKIISRAPRPLRGAFERRFCLVARRRRLDTLVEHHRDVRTERELYLGGFFWRERMLRAVQVRTKTHAFVRNFSQLGETENLKASGIGKNGAVPRHEFVEASHPPDQFVARTQIKMVGIAKNDFGAKFLKRFVAQSFDGRLRTDRHEERRFNCAVRRGQAAAASSPVGMKNGEVKTHVASLTGRSKNRKSAARNRGVTARYGLTVLNVTRRHEWTDRCSKVEGVFTLP